MFMTVPSSSAFSVLKFLFLISYVLHLLDGGHVWLTCVGRRYAEGGRL